MAAKMILYVVTNRLNSMQYVGITTRTEAERWAEHLRDARSGRGWALHSAIREFGPEAFDVEVVELAESWPELCTKERRLIALLGCLHPSGYNHTPGGEGSPGRIASAETRAKMSLAKKGKPLSAEHRAKLSAAKLGKKMPGRTANHSARISDGLKRAWARRKAAQ